MKVVLWRAFEWTAAVVHWFWGGHYFTFSHLWKQMRLKIDGILPLLRLAFSFCDVWPPSHPSWGQSLAATVVGAWLAARAGSSLRPDPGLGAFVLSLLNLRSGDLSYKVTDFSPGQMCCRARRISVSIAWLWHLFCVAANLLHIPPGLAWGGTPLGPRQSLKKLFSKW